MIIITPSQMQVNSKFKIFWFRFESVKNGERGIWTLAPLLATCTLSRGVPSTSLGTSPSTPSDCSTYFKRRGWDSNPRALTDKRFSRPPHYDRFDTSPYGLFSWFSLLLFRRSAKASISKWKHRVNDFFKYLPSFFSNIRIQFSTSILRPQKHRSLIRYNEPAVIPI